MREIKFRAWDGNKKVWLIGNLNFLLQWAADGYYCDRDMENVEWQQFTGLLDKNGNHLQEVYENDIIDMQGRVIGNKYQNYELLKDPSNFLIQGFGTANWEATNKEAMGRGCTYA